MVFDFDGRQLALDTLLLKVCTPRLLILLRIGHIEKCPLGSTRVTSWSKRFKEGRIIGAFLVAHMSNLLSFGVQSIHTLGSLQSWTEGSWWLA